MKVETSGGWSGGVTSWW